MRLIIKTTLLYLFLAMLVFGIGGVIIHSMVKQEVQRETDYALLSNLRLLVQSIEEGKPVDAFQNRKVNIVPLGIVNVEEQKPVITDTLVMHLDRLEPFRQLHTVKIINGEAYQFRLMDVFIESKDMYKGVLRTMSWLYLGLSLVLLIFGFLLSHWLFRPFQLILKQMEDFNLKSKTSMELPETKTKEFNMLSSFFQKMASKARKDYLSLKEFSENASHEMQTPIAVAQGKLELLQESPDLEPPQLQLLQSAQGSLHKLSKLGQSLSLLTKIENKEFTTFETINFSNLVSTIWGNFEELASLKGMKAQTEIQPGCTLQMEPLLADILVSNLLKNAIQHNIPNGWLKLQLSENILVVSNSGPPPAMPTYKLFERFKKSNQSGGSLGLGLAIVKKICDANHLDVDYSYNEGEHRIEVRF